MMFEIRVPANDESKQAMLASIVEYSDDAIISKALDGIIISWNQAAELLFGFSANEAIGRHISLIIPDDRMDEETVIIDKIKNGKKVSHFETIRLAKSGSEVPISLTVSPIKDRAGNVIGASKVARDISRQKIAEQQLQSYAAQLEEIVLQRTASLQQSCTALELAKDEIGQSLEIEKEAGRLKSRFVSMASHEFRTPLTAIKLSASLIGNYTGTIENPQISKHINKIKNAVGNLTGILNDFLSLEKLESGKVELAFSSFDLVKLAEEITEEMQMGAKLGQNIIYQHTGKTSTINLDLNLLKNCIFNLISNAIKYSGEETFIEFNTEINAEHCIITVKDNGIGIPDNDQKNLFGAFFRAHNIGNIPGTGLGLNIVARYTSLMNGRIDFKSVVNKSTCFTLSFDLI